MNIILTYNPCWEYTPEDQPYLWTSLNSVDYVTRLLEDTGNDVYLVEADCNLEDRIKSIHEKYSEVLVFWLNCIMPPNSGKEKFTVSVIEKLGMMRTGPSSEAVRNGLDKEATKTIFRNLGLATPESVVIYPGDYLPIKQCKNWNGYTIVKPLLQYCSKGINEFSVTLAGDFDAIIDRTDRIHQSFNEPAIVEKYIGGKDAKEFTVPILISHDGRMAELPIVEFDLNCIPLTQSKFKYLTLDIKNEGHFQKLPADLPSDTISRIYSDSRRIVTKIGCKDFARVDVRMDSTGIYYLEVNVYPDISQFNNSLTLSAYSLGLTYPELIAFIPYQAMLKYGLKPPDKLEDLSNSVMELFESSFAIEPAEVY